MITRIEITTKKDFQDTVAKRIMSEAADLDIQSINKVFSYSVTYLLGNISTEQKQTIAEKLLADTIVQDYSIDEYIKKSDENDIWSVVCISLDTLLSIELFDIAPAPSPLRTNINTVIIGRMFFIFIPIY